MKTLRSFFAVILVLVATVLVSCSSPQAVVPTYTPERIQTLNTYRIPVDKARTKMSELGELIQEENWNTTLSYIHGPLGFLRRDFRYLSSNLIPEDDEKAQEIAADLFLRLENIDVAAKEKNSTVAAAQYLKAVNDLDSYVRLIPKEPTS